MQEQVIMTTAQQNNSSNNNNTPPDLFEDSAVGILLATAVLITAIAKLIKVLV